jgi:hypothetical protein
MGIAPRFHLSLKTFSWSVFDDSVSKVLALVLTGRDFVGVCMCLQTAHTRVEMMGFFGRGGGRKVRLSDIGEGKGMCYAIVVPLCKKLLINSSRQPIQ